MTDRVDIPPGFDSERSDSMTKRYPTRMHEVLGVETGEVFDYEGRTWTISESGVLSIVSKRPGCYEVVGPSAVCLMINHPERITRRPRLTEEREEHIAALKKYRDGIRSGGISVPYDDLMIALDAAITALRGPQPDTDCGGKIRIDIPPGNDSVRASTGLQRDGGDKTERRCNQCVICGAEMPEGDQVCGYCRRKHGY